jgi:hypothetical protein
MTRCRDMARFWFSIAGDDLWHAMMLLNGANIPTIAVSEGYYQPPPELTLFRLTAAVDADTEEVAMARVTVALSEGYRVERRAELEPRYVVKKKWPHRQGKNDLYAGARVDLSMAIVHAEQLDAERGSDDYQVDIDTYDPERPGLVTV